MVTFKVLLCIFVLFGSENLFTFAQNRNLRRCFDCVSVKSCDSALNFASRLYDGSLPNEKRQVFFDAMCGYDNNIPKVCCSDFPIVTGLRAGVPDEQSEESTSAPSIESHKNFHLLPSTCGDIDGTRIYNGEVAKLYEFPWMTLIAYNTRGGVEFRCGGSVINSRYILTAAHCVIRDGVKKNIAGVRIGEIDYSTDMDCQGNGMNMICETKIQDIEVEEIIPHENFNEQQPISADIALLRLTEPIITHNNAGPVCLPVYENLRTMSLAGLNGTVAGWGITENQTESTRLMKVTIPIKSGDACNSYYNRYETQNVIDKVFCAGTVKKDSCRGDSGGPLMVETDFDESIRLVQFGIVSFGPSSCGSQFPGVYTDVSKYVGWILDNIKE